MTRRARCDYTGPENVYDGTPWSPERDPAVTYNTVTRHIHAQESRAMAETQIYYGSAAGETLTVLGPYSREGIQAHVRAQRVLNEHHGAGGEIYKIDATSIEDARAKLASSIQVKRERDAAPRRSRAAR